MVFLKRKALEKLSNEELIGDLLIVNPIQQELANLTSRFDEILEKYMREESAF